MHSPSPAGRLTVELAVSMLVVVCVQFFSYSIYPPLMAIICSALSFICFIFYLLPVVGRWCTGLGPRLVFLCPSIYSAVETWP